MSVTSTGKRRSFATAWRPPKPPPTTTTRCEVPAAAAAAAGLLSRLLRIRRALDGIDQTRVLHADPVLGIDVATGTAAVPPLACDRHRLEGDPCFGRLDCCGHSGASSGERAPDCRRLESVG